MKLQALPLAGLYEVRHEPKRDPRGSFTRLFCEAALAPIRRGLHFPQINLSRTRGHGTVRGLHYQAPPAMEAKLVQCVRGRVFDVVVDVREGSPTFLQWHGIELSEGGEHALFIPEGFAHGFQTLSDEAHLLYMHTASWTASAEAGLRHDDPSLAIRWPLPAESVSARDQGHPLVDDAFRGIPA